MELILISNTKLKIMLNENDMQRYKIGSESDCAEPDTRRAIRSLLDCAREQIGFNTEGEEIFVQLYTSKKGGCELFVTKCHDSALCEESAERLIKSVGSSYDSHYSSRRRDAERVSSTTVKERKMISTTQEKKERIAFSFPDCKSLLKVCHILDRSVFRADSRAFADEGGNYYLLLTKTGTSAYSRLDRLSFIIEYGKRENPDCLVSYIYEHGKVICNRKAIETLAQF